MSRWIACLLLFCIATPALAGQSPAVVREPPAPIVVPWGVFFGYPANARTIVYKRAPFGGATIYVWGK